MLRCAQRGCEVQPDQAEAEFCPTCNHPLRVIEQSDTPVEIGEDGPLLATPTDGAPASS